MVFGSRSQLFVIFVARVACIPRSLDSNTASSVRDACCDAVVTVHAAAAATAAATASAATTAAPATTTTAVRLGQRRDYSGDASAAGLRLVHRGWVAGHCGAAADHGGFLRGYVSLMAVSLHDCCSARDD